ERNLAVKTLVENRDASALPLIVEALSDADERVQFEAEHAFPAFGATPAFEAAMRSTYSQTKERAIAITRNYPPVNAADAERRAALLLASLDDPNQLVRIQAMQALAQLAAAVGPSALEIVAARFEDRDER